MNSIGRANLDGSNPESLTTSVDSPAGEAVDAG